MQSSNNKRGKVTGKWRKLHNEELNDLYCSPNIIRVSKSRRMRWTKLVDCMGERGGDYTVLVGQPEGRKPLGRLDVFLTVHHSTDLSKYQLIAHSLNIQQYKLHYTSQHVSSSTLLIIRRTNYITTASGIVPLCKQPYSMRVERGPLSTRILYGCLQRVTIPEAVVIQLVLLMMSSVLLETC